MQCLVFKLKWVHTWAQVHCRCLFLANTIQRNGKQVFRCRSVNILSLADNGGILDIVNISVFWEFRWISRSALLRHIAVCKTWPCYRLFCQRSSMFTPQARVTKSFSFKRCSYRPEANASIACKWASIVFSIEIDFAKTENKVWKRFTISTAIAFADTFAWCEQSFTTLVIMFGSMLSQGLQSDWQVTGKWSLESTVQMLAQLAVNMSCNGIFWQYIFMAFPRFFYIIVHYFCKAHAHVTISFHLLWVNFLTVTCPKRPNLVVSVVTKLCFIKV